MALILSEREKLLIIILASSLFLLSVLVTVCVVLPVCWFHKWLFYGRFFGKDDGGKKSGHSKAGGPTRLIAQESKHFQLSVVPLYGSSDVKPQPTARETSSVGDKVKSNGTVASVPAVRQPNTAKLKLDTRYEVISDCSVRLHLTVVDVRDVEPREYGLEPSCYVCLKLFGHGGRARGRSLNHKSMASAAYRTSTAKRCLNPVFGECFTSPELPKSVLRDGLLVVSLYDDERYANDVCLGQTKVSLKKLSIGTTAETKELSLCHSKEFKGELLIGLCYLPTSKRVTISIVKANLNHHNSHNSNLNSLCYYVRALMFTNGKLVKKKKSATSQKLLWGDQETLTFDLLATDSQESAFMVALSAKRENSASPSSPDTPGTPDGGGAAANDSRKDRHVGHFVMGKEIWIQLKQQPRKQILKWHKLY